LKSLIESLKIQDRSNNSFNTLWNNYTFLPSFSGSSLSWIDQDRPHMSATHCQFCWRNLRLCCCPTHPNLCWRRSFASAMRFSIDNFS
jgi:hypothetical protein